MTKHNLDQICKDMECNCDCRHKGYIEPNESHYHQTKAQPIDLLDDELKRGFFVGNVIKYVSRFRYKNGIDDLYKAKKYLQWLIELEEKEQE